VVDGRGNGRGTGDPGLDETVSFYFLMLTAGAILGLTMIFFASWEPRKETLLQHAANVFRDVRFALHRLW
jgi:hypothetical protein